MYARKWRHCHSVYSPYTISIPLSPSPSKLGRQPCWAACLLVCVSGYHPLQVLYTDLYKCKSFNSFSVFLPRFFSHHLALGLKSQQLRSQVQWCGGRSKDDCLTISQPLGSLHWLNNSNYLSTSFIIHVFVFSCWK
jgi:hypothetical protein